MILDGKKVRDELLVQYKKYIQNNNLNLTLAIILVGDDPASLVYIKNKEKYANLVGINTKLIHLKESTTEEVINIINDLNNDNNITGIILQSPVPNNIDFNKCIDAINYKKDVDGFTKDNWFNLTHNIKGLRPCTAKGIMYLLEKYGIDVASKNVCIIGRGNIVGKPLLFEMLNHNATVDICHSKTVDLKKHTLNADIIISATGHANLLTSDMVNENSIVVDTGITMIDGKIKGDADFENLVSKCLYITPNPGGVGPMTIAMILNNVIEASKLQ